MRSTTARRGTDLLNLSLCAFSPSGLFGPLLFWCPRADSRSCPRHRCHRPRLRVSVAWRQRPTNGSAFDGARVAVAGRVINRSRVLAAPCCMLLRPDADPRPSARPRECGRFPLLLGFPMGSARSALLGQKCHIADCDRSMRKLKACLLNAFVAPVSFPTIAPFARTAGRALRPLRPMRWLAARAPIHAHGF